MLMGSIALQVFKINLVFKFYCYCASMNVFLMEHIQYMIWGPTL